VTSLRFSVLGPVSAARGNADVPLGPAKQRAVLAVLLLGDNRPVSRDEIIDGVWGEQAPPTAPNLVATYVARLRRALEPGRTRRGAGEVLTSTGAGYALRRGPDQLDLDRFERLAAGGQADTLDQALALWRGQPLDGLPGPFAAAERGRLVERRLTVLERRIELGLALGEHADRVAELTRLVAAHPYRERLRALLMLALHRAGRQAEALAVFADARRTLADDLGIEPGAELRHLHHRILTADPGLRLPVRSVPVQLPADLADFTGRVVEVATVTGWLARREHTVLTGCAGVGKTSLAVHAAHLTRRVFPDGQLYADLRGAGQRPERADEVLARFLQDLGVAPADIPAPLDRRAALWRTRLSERRILIVLDDARDAAQVAPLLPGVGDSAVLVTSRARLGHPAGARILGLDVLAPDEAGALLARIVGADRLADDPAAAADVVAACAGLPLAVRVAGVRLASRPGWTVRTLADRLLRQERRLSELRPVGASFHVSYAALPDARPFRLLGLLDAPDVTAPVVAALTGFTVDDAEQALEELVDAHLLESREPGRYQPHLLLHLFAREQAQRAESPPARRAALERAARHYAGAVRRADALLRPGRMSYGPEPTGPGPGAEPTGPGFASNADALDWLERERAAIIGVGLQVARTPGIDPMLVATLVTDLRAFLHRRGYWDDLWQLAEAAAGAARRAAHDHALALATLELGSAAYLRQWYRRAEVELRHSLALLRGLDDPYGRSRALNNLSLVCAELGRHEEAARLVDEDLALLRELGDRSGESVALDNLALVEVRRGRYAEAIVHCVRSVELNRAIGSPLLACAALNILGMAQDGLGRHHRAAWCQRRSRKVARRAGNRYREAQALSDLAAAYRAGGRPRRAVTSGRQAVLIARRLGDVHGAATALSRVADAFADLGQIGRARACRARATSMIMKDSGRHSSLNPS